MKQGLILAGEPMGLLIAQSEGALGSVTGYDLAGAGAEFNVAVGVARLGHRVTYLTKLGEDPLGERIIRVLTENGIGNELALRSATTSRAFACERSSIRSVRARCTRQSRRRRRSMRVRPTL